MKAQEGECWENGKSRRVVKEANPGETDRRIQVIYTLYRQVELWSQDGNRRYYEWWILREGYCSMATWERWERKAVKVTS